MLGDESVRAARLSATVDTLVSDRARITAVAEDWKRQCERLSDVVTERDKEIRGLIETLDTCTDPGAVGRILLARMREPLPRPITPVTRRLPINKPAR